MRELAVFKSCDSRATPDDETAPRDDPRRDPLRVMMLDEGFQHIAVRQTVRARNPPP